MKKNKPHDKEAYQGDVLDLLRKIVGAPTLDDMKDYDRLQGQERIDFLKYCSGVYRDKHFEEICKSLIFECVLNAGLEARNFDEVLVNRATANGVKTIQDFFAKYNKLYIDEFEKEPEVFDERRAFEPLK